MTPSFFSSSLFSSIGQSKMPRKISRDERARRAYNRKVQLLTRNTHLSRAHPLTKFIFSEIELQGLSVREVARLSGVGARTIQGWVYAHSRGYYDNLEAVLNVLGFTMWPQPYDPKRTRGFEPQTQHEDCNGAVSK